MRRERTENKMKNKFDCVIIGAGNGGLSAACRMATEGKKILLVEKNNMPGGCASSFVRGRFEFDASLHEICDWGADNEKGGARKLIEGDFGIDIPWLSVPDAYRVVGTKGNKKVDAEMPNGIKEYIDKMEEYVPGSRASIETFFAVCKETLNAVAYINY